MYYYLNPCRFLFRIKPDVVLCSLSGLLSQSILTLKHNITFTHRDPNTTHSFEKVWRGLMSINKHTVRWQAEVWSYELIFSSTHHNHDSSVCFKLTDTLKRSCTIVKLLQLSSNQNEKRLTCSDQTAAALTDESE